ncbi:hypothetical protein NLJ89_g9259 [Agrocybe chaxingu]|uniref:ABC transporter domain-containing protein n=1 Tax=Agrocybe chaxingu TaxID=84603 RepID=A0A9W8JTN8_9AGAR|nr:hypothetical protein NLJ89_g9259 [Agrocybe chaxingu]
MSDHLPPLLTDIVEEAPSATISRAASQPTLRGNDTPVDEIPPLPYSHHEHHPPPPSSPRPAEYKRRRDSRRDSQVSHVSVEFFDPAGVEQLRRTLTQQTKQEQHEMQELGGSHPSAASSEVTLHMDGDGPFDFEKMLRHAIRKRDERQIKHRSLGIVFQNVHVVGHGVSDSFQPTLGSVLNPLSAIEQIQKARHPALRDILVGFEGVVKPREMLLVLGSPGSGCSTLLKTLANHRKEYYSVQGDVHYDSLSHEDLDKHFRGDVQYCPEDDVHFPTLTVEQTLKFAATARTPRVRVDTSREEFADWTTNLLATIFGLKHVLNTPVGDASIRGVSGGQKKRVSIAEALAARSCIGAWDNSTRGLDASTALEFVRALRIATDIFEQTTIVSIYQAGESLYQYFDKVCVIYEGRMAYFGPADQARQYFIDMGYVSLVPSLH